MGKKKFKPNAFSVFMHEYLDREKLRSRTPKEQWAAVAKPHYEKLTAEQKEKYKQMAKTMPSRTVTVPAKYTSQGVPLEQVEREQQQLAEKSRRMHRVVRDMVANAFLNNDIKDRPFVFIMANHFYKTHDGTYSPAEIAVAKFTFEDGITKYYHSYINPGTVALGYAFTAKDNSEKYHRLPPPPNAKGEKDYEKVYTGILDVLGVRQGQTFENTDERRPCVFIRQQDKEMIESILDQLSDKQWEQTFDVFDLELLFNELKNKVAPDGVPLRITVTSAFIEQDRYDATPDISCDFHEQKDATRYCALSHVRRWFYLFADHICEKIDVDLIAGKHVPQNAAIGPPPPPFDDDDAFGDGAAKHNFKDDYSANTASTYTGYSQFANSDSSDSDY